jgi:MFS family permease
MIDRSLRYFRQFTRNLWVLAIGWFVSSFGFAISIPFIAIYFHAKLGLSISVIGLFFGAMAVIRSIFQMIGGELSDRMEQSALLINSQIIRAGAFLGLAAAIYLELGFLPIAFFLLINSIFGAIFQPVANAMVSSILPHGIRLDGYAITRSAGNLGWAAGPALGGFLAVYSYGLLFILSAGITLASGLIFFFFLKIPKSRVEVRQFKLSEMMAVREDPHFARHCMLIFFLYIVVAQLFAPFSLYTVEMKKLSESRLGLLYMVNGLMVVMLQLPVTRILSRIRFTSQLALGAFFYAAGYAMLGAGSGFEFFMFVVAVVTIGEIVMSPASLALTARLAPPDRMGRYMGAFGFFVTAGWSLGPLYGGFILERFADNHTLAWVLIALLAVVSGAGYLIFTRKLPPALNRKER